MRTSSLVFFVLSLLALAAPGRADTEFKAHGGPGDRSTPRMCDPGSYIVGFAGRTGAWIDNIAPICAPLQDPGGLGQRSTEPPAGGSGGGPNEKTCDRDEVVTSMRTRLTPGRQVLHVRFTCSSIKTWQAHDKVFGGNGVFEETQKTEQQTCPYGEVAGGVRVNWGEHVNAVGLICTTYRVTYLQPTVETEFDRPGSDYASFDLGRADPGECIRACLGDSKCRAYTYVFPGFQGEAPRCWLKSSVPPAVANNCCVSGYIAGR